MWTRRLASVFRYIFMYLFTLFAFYIRSNVTVVHPPPVVNLDVQAVGCSKNIDISKDNPNQRPPALLESSKTVSSL